MITFSKEMQFTGDNNITKQFYTFVNAICNILEE